MTTGPDFLPLISDSGCSAVPVFNCQIILSTEESGQKIVGRVTNLGRITVDGNTECNVLMQVTKVFQAQVQTLNGEKSQFRGSTHRKRPDQEKRNVSYPFISGANACLRLLHRTGWGSNPSPCVEDVWEHAIEKYSGDDQWPIAGNSKGGRIGLAGQAIRDVAQPGRALRSGRRGRKFNSCHPDFY